MINSVLDSIDEDFKNFAPLTFLKNLTSLKPSFIVLPLIVLTLFLAVVAPSVASPLVTLITIVYPGYMTFEVANFFIVLGDTLSEGAGMQEMDGFLDYF